MTNPSTVHLAAPTGGPDRGRPDRRRRGIPLGRWGGIQVTAHWTSVFILALFAEALATSILPTVTPGHSGREYWIVGAVTAAVFLVTLLVHEFAHALTARHYRLGVGGITLWLLGGVTELDDEAPAPRADGLIAAAGPIASVVVGGVTLSVAALVGTSSLIGAALAWLGVINVFLAIVNLLPGAPLDGGRIVRAVLWARWGDRSRAEVAVGRAGRAIGFGLVGLGLFDLAMGASAGIWLALVGWFVIAGGTAEQRTGAVAGLAHLTAGAAMRPTAGPVAEWWTLTQFDTARVEVAAPADAVFTLVNFGGEATGAVRRADLDRVPADDRDDTRLRDVRRVRYPSPLLVGADAPLIGVAAHLRAGGGLAVVVDEERRPIGTITPDDLSRAARPAVPVTPVAVSQAS